MRLGTVTRQPVMRNVHTYTPKRYTWDQRKCYVNFGMLAAILFSLGVWAGIYFAYRYFARLVLG